MHWKKEYCNCVTSIDELKKYTDITHQKEKKLEKIIDRHPMCVTKHYLSLIKWEDPRDPLMKMVIPSEEELNISGSYDTSGEKESTKLLGLQHKYSQTALILSTSRCASYCRFCFRKRLVGLPNREILKNFIDAVNYINNHKEINNVLISGGDPLILETKVIKKFLEMLSSISHLKFIRIGSKVPVYLPNRIIEDRELLKVLQKYSLPQKRLYIVTQIDHPREISNELITAVRKLLHAEIILNNQTVLMKGINDDPEVLAKLQNNLVAIGINPYYVFQCRPVKRVKQFFQLPLFAGYNIVEEAKKKLNGHSKRFKYVMSHNTGKIEIIGTTNDKMFFKYHQARNPRNLGKIFSRKLNKKAGWLDEMH